MTPQYPQAYIEFLSRFHGDRDYFECHELLEQYWKEHPASPYNKVWVGLIQAAVALYHQRRGNVAGAVKSLTNSINNSDPSLLRELGIDAAVWLERLQSRRAILVNDPNVNYADMNIPLTDERLAHRCRALTVEHGFMWCGSSDFGRSELIHRHLLRDRSDVIEQRRKALETRHGG